MPSPMPMGASVRSAVLRPFLAWVICPFMKHGHLEMQLCRGHSCAVFQPYLGPYHAIGW